MLFLKKDSEHINHLRGGHLQSLWEWNREFHKLLKNRPTSPFMLLGRRFIPVTCLMSWPMQMDFVMKISVFSSWMWWSLLNVLSHWQFVRMSEMHMPVVVLLPSANIQTKYVKCRPGHIHMGCNKHLVSSVPVLHKAVNTFLVAGPNFDAVPGLMQLCI